MAKKPPIFKLEEKQKMNEAKPPLEEECHGLKQIEISISRGGKKYLFLLKGKNISKEGVLSALESEGSLFDVDENLLNSDVLIKDGSKWREFGFLSLEAFYKRALEEETRKNSGDILDIEETTFGPENEKIIRHRKIRSTDGAELGSIGQRKIKSTFGSDSGIITGHASIESIDGAESGVIAGHRKVKSISGAESGGISGHASIESIDGAESGVIAGHRKVKSISGAESGGISGHTSIESTTGSQPGQIGSDIMSRVIEEEIEKQKKRIKKEPWE